MYEGRYQLNPHFLMKNFQENRYSTRYAGARDRSPSPNVRFTSSPDESKIFKSRQGLTEIIKRPTLPIGLIIRIITHPHSSTHLIRTIEVRLCQKTPTLIQIRLIKEPIHPREHNHKLQSVIKILISTLLSEQTQQRTRRI